MNSEKKLLLFTEKLSELLSSGIDLSASLTSLKSDIANEIFFKIEEGESFSRALSLCQRLHFPNWYIGFIKASEVGGNLSRTITFLSKTIKEITSVKEKFLNTMLYPIFVVFLAIVCGGISLFTFTSFVNQSSYFGVDSKELWTDVIESYLIGFTFLSTVLCIFIFLLKKISSVRPTISLFTSLSFLTEENVPIMNAINCSLSMDEIEKSASLYRALLDIRLEIMNGELPSIAFSDALLRAGFDYESQIAYSCLSVSEVSGKNDAFSKISKILTEKNEKNRKLVMSFEQPVLLCSVAIFLVIILKSTFFNILFPIL